ncbi:MAG: nucleotidyltransferase domain-containing protein [Anaerolineales bacterium]|jgi:hypothetical protein
MSYDYSPTENGNLPRAHEIALRRLLPRLVQTDFEWALTGSASFTLRGIPFDPEDLDLQTSQAGAYELERLFAEYLERPVRYTSNERVRSYWGCLRVDGVEVEIIGAIQKRLPDGSWSEPPDLSGLRVYVYFAGYMLPVLDLKYESQAYALLGRQKRSVVLKDWSERL